MALGLTADEMYAVLLKSLHDRGAEFAGTLEAARHGENPQLASEVEAIRQAMPNLQPELLLVLKAVGYAFCDVLVANNLALASAVPHIAKKP